MTVVVGIKCENGIVVGADGSATSSDGVQPTIEQPMDKIDLIGNRIIFTGSGAVGIKQRFLRILNDCYSKEQVFKKRDGHSHFVISKNLTQRFLKDLSETGLAPGQPLYQRGSSFAGLLAFVYDNEPYLCEFPQGDLQPEFKEDQSWFCALGCGQRIVDPFLGFINRVFFPDKIPSLLDGIFIANWAIRHAINLNTGGINDPISMAIIEKNGHNKFEVRKLSEDELLESEQMIQDVEKYMSSYKTVFQQQGGDSPPIPTPQS